MTISRRILVLSGMLLSAFRSSGAESQDIVVEVKKITRLPRSGGPAIFPLFKTNGFSQPATTFQVELDLDVERVSTRTNLKASTRE
jgi:hypothetical protein